MNINTISTGYQPSRAYSKVGFKGAQKIAAQLTNADTTQKVAIT